MEHPICSRCHLCGTSRNLKRKTNPRGCPRCQGQHEWSRGGRNHQGGHHQGHLGQGHGVPWAQGQKLPVGWQSQREDRWKSKRLRWEAKHPLCLWPQVTSFVMKDLERGYPGPIVRLSATWCCSTSPNRPRLHKPLDASEVRIYWFCSCNEKYFLNRCILLHHLHQMWKPGATWGSNKAEVHWERSCLRKLTVKDFFFF